MLFVLTGFSQVMGERIFTFDGVAADRTRTPYTVKADLALSRTYGIRLQELPLLCRAVLDRRAEGEGLSSFTYTEQEMSQYAESCATARGAIAARRKPPRRPTVDLAGSPWRGPMR